MRIFNFMALAMATLAICSCSGEKGTVISGTVAADVAQLEVYDIDPTGTEIMDTIQVTNNEFKITLDIDTADFVLIKITDNYAVPLFISPGDKIELDLKGSDEDQDYDVSGNHESERIWNITQIRNRSFDRIDSLNEASQAIRNTPEFAIKKVELDSLFQKVVTGTADQYKAMIDEEPGSIANIFIFSQTIGNYPLISAQDDFDYFEKVDRAIDENYGYLKHTANFHASINRLRDNLAIQEKMRAVKDNLSAGSEVPEIILADLDGNERKLSDLRGKVVLVDFWAAWCRPCRAQNPFIVKMYNDFKDQGFDVYSVSLDGLPQQQNPKEEWKQAIEMDGLTWENHVSDLKGWDSEVVPDFGFNGIPFTILVDREGKIIATELRGPELEAAVKEALGV